MNNEKLKPCPFCGGEAVVHTLGTGYMVECLECAVRTVCENTKAEAIAAWNGRASVKQNAEMLDTNSVASSGVNAKLTYADIERMVKPLDWDGDTATLRLDGYREVIFRVQRSGQSDIFAAQIEIDGDIFTIECGLAEEDAKPVLQEFLVDLVAAALGVERSGE